MYVVDDVGGGHGRLEGIGQACQVETPSSIVLARESGRVVFGGRVRPRGPPVRHLRDLLSSRGLRPMADVTPRPPDELLGLGEGRTGARAELSPPQFRL